MTLNVPLAVRLKTSRADKHITHDVRDLSFRSDIPGGFASCQVSLDRPLSLDPDEIQLYGDLYVYDGRNGETVWQGRLEDPGRGAGEQGQVWTLTATGPSAHAKDRTIPLVYIDQNLDRWVYFLRPNSHSDGTRRVQEDEGGSGKAAIHLQFANNTVVVTNSNTGLRFRDIFESGQNLARFDYAWDAGRTDGNAHVKMIVRLGGTTSAPRDQTLSTGGGGSSPKVVGTDWTHPKNICDINLEYEGGTSPATVTSDDYWVSVFDMSIMGTRYNASGSELTSGSDYSTATILASDIVNDLLGRLLNQYDGANANVTASSYGIDHLSYPDGATAFQVLDDLMKVEIDMYWAAWEGSPARFEFVNWPTTIAYEASTKDGFESPGSAAELFNEVTVRWRDPRGHLRATTRTQTVDLLDDAGLTRTALIDLGDNLGSSGNADQIGDEFLSQHAIPPNAGTLRVRTPIFDAGLGRTVQPWEIRPGKLIRARDVLPRVDALNATARDAVTVFRVIGVEYSASDNTATLDLDSKPRTLRNIAADAAELVGAGKRRR